MENRFLNTIKRGFSKTFCNRSGENTITVLDAKQMLNINSNIVLLDVRSSMEHNENNIPGSILIPLYELQKKAEIVLKDKTQTIIVYCKSGVRSEKAVRILRDLGYLKAYNVEGRNRSMVEILAEWDFQGTSLKIPLCQNLFVKNKF